MSENAITFSELRKIQKEERRSDDLKELDDNFFIKVGDYLNRKKEVEDGSREYKNAKRVFRKILSLREDKIVKNARLSLKSNIQASELNMLPREQELFRRMKQEFNRHRDEIQEVTEEHRGKTPAHEREEIEESMNNEDSDTNHTEREPETEENKEEAENTEESKEDSFDTEEGYEVVEITSDVPEFMGTDLEAYGPFEEGEQAEIPEDNAEILVNRGNAEQLS
jgi:DNA replication initiation complex subunit (GINS family)